MADIEHTTSEKHLPEGWAVAELTHVANIIMGQSPPGKTYNTASNGLPFFQGKAEFGEVHPTVKKWCSKPNKIAEAGDVLLSIRAPVGPTNIANQECAIGRGLAAIRPLMSIPTELILYTIRSQENFLSTQGTGSTFTAINKSYINEIKVKLPPLTEQKRIVIKVNQLLARVDVVRQRLANVPAILKRFRQSVLAAACSGRLTEDWREKHTDIEPAADLLNHIRKKRKKSYETACKEASENGLQKPKKPASLNIRNVDTSILPGIPDKWHWVYLPELGELNQGKSRHRPRNAEHLYGGLYPFIQTGEIARSGGRIASHAKTYSEAGLAQSRLWPAETVCITIAANIADSAILTYPACFPDSVVGLITERSLCLNKYAEFFIRTARDDLSQFAPATAQKNINLGILSEVAVPLPPFEEQQEIVRRVEGLFVLADKTENRVRIATDRADKMTQSILAKAFRGELVPTEAELARLEGRDYETAQQLLERIQSNKK